MARSSSGGKTPTGVTWPQALALGLKLPGAEESTSYGTPALKVKGKLFARLKEDGETLVVKMDMDERAMRMKDDPGTFFITDHYADYPYVLVRLSEAHKQELQQVLEDAWRSCAPKRLLAEFDRE